MTRGFILVALGGALGSMARHGVGVLLSAWVGAGFPWATLSVNVLGSFLIGVITVLALEQGRLSDETRLLLATGVMGGFTTFSTFSLDVLRFIEAGEVPRAAVYVSLTLALCLAACAGGLFAGRALAP